MDGERCDVIKFVALLNLWALKLIPIIWHVFDVMRKFSLGHFSSEKKRLISLNLWEQLMTLKRGGS